MPALRSTSSVGNGSRAGKGQHATSRTKTIKVILRTVPRLRGKQYDDQVTRRSYEVIISFPSNGDDIVHTTFKAGIATRRTVRARPLEEFSRTRLSIVPRYRITGKHALRHQLGREHEFRWRRPGCRLGSMFGAEMLNAAKCEKLPEKKRLDLTKEANDFGIVVSIHNRIFGIVPRRFSRRGIRCR